MSELPSPVCVTGASGFIASHLVEQLLAAGATVRGTVRDPSNERSVGHLRAMPGADERLTLFAGDLLDPDGFDAALEGCVAVAHTASPYALTVDDPQRDLVDPAVKGTRHVLDAATRAGTVKRVVLTSSMAAVTDEPDGRVLTEADWNDRSSLTRNPYYYSKMLAEREAWSIAEKAPWGLAVINPFLVIGPSYTKALNTSNRTLRDMLNGTYPGLIDLNWGFVDVRDVARAHVRALEVPGASGRYVCANEVRSMRAVAEALTRLGYRGVPSLPLDNGFGSFVVRLGLPFQPSGARSYLKSHLGRPLAFDHGKIVRELGFAFTPLDDSLRDAVEDLIRWEHLPASVRGHSA